MTLIWSDRIDIIDETVYNTKLVRYKESRSKEHLNRWFSENFFITSLCTT